MLKSAAGLRSIRTRVDRRPAATARSAEATALGAGLLLSALRAIAVGRDHPEYGPITTDRALRRFD
jgi:hypothetical protein